MIPTFAWIFRNTTRGRQFFSARSVTRHVKEKNQHFHSFFQLGMRDPRGSVSDPDWQSFSSEVEIDMSSADSSDEAQLLGV